MVYLPHCCYYDGFSIFSIPKYGIAILYVKYLTKTLYVSDMCALLCSGKCVSFGKCVSVCVCVFMLRVRAHADTVNSEINVVWCTITWSKSWSGTLPSRRPCQTPWHTRGCSGVHQTPTHTSILNHLLTLSPHTSIRFKPSPQSMSRYYYCLWLKKKKWWKYEEMGWYI